MPIQLLKCSEVAQILNISRGAAYRLVQQGKISSVKFNSSVRVKPEDLEDFIRKSWVDANGNEVKTIFASK